MIRFNPFFVIFCLILVVQAYAQLPVKRDDYVGHTNRNWWDWYDDGPNTPMPSVEDGFVLFSLVDPVIDYDPFCDAALWDGYPYYGGPYHYCQITLRAKALNPPKIGSRGWGLWFTEPYPYVQNQAWFMRVHDSSGSGYTGLDWWRAETANGRTEATHNFTELTVPPHVVDDQIWHVYKIIRDSLFIAMIVDNDTVLYATQNLPEQDMAFHIWVDNLIYEHVDPDIINIYKREWKGKNEIVLDYVQIVSPGGKLNQSKPSEGICLLRQVPNAIYDQPAAGLWMEYTFNCAAGNWVVLSTARVENYLKDDTLAISDDDDIRFEIDGIDYGWDSPFSFNGDAAGTQSKTILLSQPVDSGSHTIRVYGETSPLLHDVTVLWGEQGGIVFDQEFNETKTEGSDSLWKSIDFSTKGGRVAIYVSAIADEDPSPTNYGYQYADFDDTMDDEMRLELDGKNYGYKNEYAFYGNRQFGEARSVLLQDSLTAGNHTLRLYAHHTPTLLRVIIFGENDEVTSGILQKRALPEDFNLSSNFPNPFNGRTQIRFYLKHSSEAELSVFNALGQKICTLLKGRQNAGHYSLFWDGMDGSHRAVSSGIYFCVLKVEGRQPLRRKMLLIR